MAFELDARLAKDTHPLHQSKNWLLLLMNDSRYPWFIIVPKVDGARELHDLPPELAKEVFDYALLLGKAIGCAYNATKINTAALGNVVEQLHIHVIGRFTHDPAWPQPVWGHSEPIPYDNENLNLRLKQLKQLTNLNIFL